MPKRVMIATGGTGGHIYPAIALAQQIVDTWEGSEVLFVGGGLDRNKYFDRNAFRWKAVSCGTFPSLSPLPLLKSLFRIAKGIKESCRAIREFKPDVVVGFGSYYSFPPLVAAKMLSVPYLLHEANAIPGKVIRVLSRWAAVTGVHFPLASDYLKGKCVEVGMPLRRGFRKDDSLRNKALEYFGFYGECFTLLVFGGSQGAKAVNEAVMSGLTAAVLPKGFRVIHIAGDPAEAERISELYRQLNIKAVVKPYEENMQHAWQAADAVVCRSGAGAVAELLEFEVPCLLVPFARAADDHQNINADFISRTVGGGVKVLEKEIASGDFQEAFQGLVNRDATEPMRRAMREYKRLSRTQDMLSLIENGKS